MAKQETPTTLPSSSKKMGRPTTYTQALADRICEEIANGSSVRTVAKSESMPAPSSIFKWLREHKEFSEQYARACEERSEAMSEDILDIADDGTNDWMEVNRRGHQGWETNGEALQRSRLRVDTRKWLMSKMKPKKYGDRLDLNSESTVTHKYEDMTDEQLEAIIKARKD